jgi:hypothetical protein
VDEKMLRTLVDAGALRKVQIVGNGALLYVVVNYGTKTEKVLTQRGSLRTWASLDSVARWLRGLGLGKAELELAGWAPGQRGLKL